MTDYYFEIDDRCDICGISALDCICPECPICGVQGDPNCYGTHINQKHKQRPLQIDGVYMSYDEADNLFSKLVNTGCSSKAREIMEIFQ